MSCNRCPFFGICIDVCVLPRKNKAEFFIKLVIQNIRDVTDEVDKKMKGGMK